MWKLKLDSIFEDKKIDKNKKAFYKTRIVEMSVDFPCMCE